MNRSRENLPVAISADWHSPIISATIYLRVARRGSIIAAVIWLNDRKYMGSNLSKGDLVAVIDGYFQNHKGVVLDVSPKPNFVTVEIDIFGRPAPIEIESNYLKKIDQQ